MTNECFYCTHDAGENESHLVTFHVTNSEREEILCEECYQEWLHGIKE
ncbi:hypothetical protein JMM81_19100 [Bacillus sp. V3B]|nr:hypothetical protein [Bacillus sp. V3B]MCQ6276986.1 hypothetical protein [Bacillus sp. V3B]